MAISKLVVTQRKRYVWAAMGQVMSVCTPIMAVGMFGPSAYLNGLAEYWQVSPVGKIVVISHVIVTVSPLLSLLTVASIYRNPATIAHWSYKRKGYVYTEDVRLGIRDPIRAWIYASVDGSGIVRKEYRNDT